MFMRMVYDERLAQAAYIIGCQATGEAIVIDPQRDVDQYIKLAEQHALKVIAAAETHIHADFVSGVRELAERVDAHVYVSAEGGPDWSSRWLDKRSNGKSYPHTLLHHNDNFSIGNIDFRIIHTPGHTPEHICYQITDRGSGVSDPIGIATGDFIFVGDLGRPDLLETAAGQSGVMQDAARSLYRSANALANIPDFVQVWPGHGAGSACGKALGAIPTSTIGYERRFNAALNAAKDESTFVDFILTGQPEPPLYFADMKRINRDGPAVLGPNSAPPEQNAPDIAAIDTTTQVILDARPWDNFKAAHVAGSLSFPIAQQSFCTDAGSMIREQDTITIIADANQIDEIVRCLEHIGRDNIRGWFDAADFDALEQAGTRISSIAEITPQQAAQRKDASILDVRRATEFAESHAPSAINFSHTRIANHTDQIDPSKNWLVVCRSGARSARSAVFLQRLGYNVTNVAGGMLAWNQLQQS